MKSTSDRMSQVVRMNAIRAIQIVCCLVLPLAAACRRGAIGDAGGGGAGGYQGAGGARVAEAGGARVAENGGSTAGGNGVAVSPEPRDAASGSAQDVGGRAGLAATGGGAGGAIGIDADVGEIPVAIDPVTGRRVFPDAGAPDNHDAGPTYCSSPRVMPSDPVCSVAACRGSGCALTSCAVPGQIKCGEEATCEIAVEKNCQATCDHSDACWATLSEGGKFKCSESDTCGATCTGACETECKESPCTFSVAAGSKVRCVDYSQCRVVCLGACEGICTESICQFGAPPKSVFRCSDDSNCTATCDDCMLICDKSSTCKCNGRGCVISQAM